MYFNLGASLLYQIQQNQSYTEKGMPRSFDFVYFLTTSLYRCATEAPQSKQSLAILRLLVLLILFLKKYSNGIEQNVFSVDTLLDIFHGDLTKKCF
jgi:hypothetical protein